MLSFLRRLRSPPNPKDSFSRLLIRADAANAARDWAGAEPAYAQALRLDPLRGDVWVQYGHTLKEQGKLDQAAEAYRAATRLGDPMPDAPLQLGHMLKRLDRAPEAVAAFLTALASDPTLDGVREEIATLGGMVPEDLARAVERGPLRDIDDLPVRVADGAARPEGGTLARPGLLQGRREPTSPRARESVAFIHLHKTGGLTLHDVLERNFAVDRVCPVKDDHLHLYSGEELARFDFFSGHFDYGALRLLQRRPLRVVSVFRSPRDRLVSFYRFHAGHDLGARHGVNAFVRLANAMTAEEFFEDERVRRAPEVFNHYLVAFGLSYHQALSATPLEASRIAPDLVGRAVARVVGLDAIGLTERFDASVALACASLGFPVPGTVKPRNETDTLGTKMKGEPPPRVTITPRLQAAMADLIRFDETIYAAAVAEFERRVAAKA